MRDILDRDGSSLLVQLHGLAWQDHRTEEGLVNRGVGRRECSNHQEDTRANKHWNAGFNDDLSESVRVYLPPSQPNCIMRAASASQAVNMK